jgi:hypothetical protein
MLNQLKEQVLRYISYCKCIKKLESDDEMECDIKMSMTAEHWWLMPVILILAT